MSKPNILFLMPDQLRHDFLSCYGADFINTPHIDSIAHEGTLYRNAYSTSPVCVTARHNILTGLNSIRSGVLNNFQFIRPDYAACGIIACLPACLNPRFGRSILTAYTSFCAISSFPKMAL